MNAVHFLNGCLLEVIYLKGLRVEDLDLTEVLDELNSIHQGYLTSSLFKTPAKKAKKKNWKLLHKKRIEQLQYRTLSPKQLNVSQLTTKIQQFSTPKKVLKSYKNRMDSLISKSLFATQKQRNPIKKFNEDI